eukprot:6188429-Pleurochrysis_carterae.AAC.3
MEPKQCTTEEGVTRYEHLGGAVSESLLEALTLRNDQLDAAVEKCARAGARGHAHAHARSLTYTHARTHAHPHAHTRTYAHAHAHARARCELRGAWRVETRRLLGGGRARWTEALSDAPGKQGLKTDGKGGSRPIWRGARDPWGGGLETPGELRLFRSGTEAIELRSRRKEESANSLNGRRWVRAGYLTRGCLKQVHDRGDGGGHSGRGAEGTEDAEGELEAGRGGGRGAEGQRGRRRCEGCKEEEGRREEEEVREGQSFQQQTS